MDLARTLPLLDRSRFDVVVGAIERRGPLATVLSDAGIDVIGPFSSGPPDRSLFNLALWVACGISRFALRVAPRSSSARLLHLGLKYLRTARRVARHLSAGHFDIVHTVSPSAYIIGALAIGWPKRQSLLMSRVSLAFYQRDARLFGALERLAHRRVDFVTGNARAILLELAAEGIPDRKLGLLRNGIDMAAFTQSMVGRAEARALLGISPDALVFTSIANLFPYKGHEDLLDALHRLLGSLPENWHLLVVGRDVSGNLERLRQQAVRQGLARHVLFLGERRDVPVILSAGDIHVSASHFEGFPNNVMEAMCAGLPVVATAVGGVREQIDDGSTGLLVPPREPTALASALLALARNPDRRKTLGQAGRLRVTEQFPLRATVRALEDAYTSIARARRQ
jgi:glycosyltransferase involved in cell wall biosynthesis